MKDYAAIRERHRALQARLIARLDRPQLEGLHAAMCRIPWRLLAIFCGFWGTWFAVTYWKVLGGPPKGIALHSVMPNSDGMLGISWWQRSLGVVLAVGWCALLMTVRFGWFSLQWRLRLGQTLTRFDVSADRTQSPLDPKVENWEAKIANDQCEVVDVSYAVRPLTLWRSEWLREILVILGMAVFVNWMHLIGLVAMGSVLFKATKQPWTLDGSEGYELISKCLSQRLLEMEQSSFADERKPKNWG